MWILSIYSFFYCLPASFALNSQSPFLTSQGKYCWISSTERCSCPSDDMKTSFDVASMKFCPEHRALIWLAKKSWCDFIKEKQTKTCWLMNEWSPLYRQLVVCHLILDRHLLHILFSFSGHQCQKQMPIENISHESYIPHKSFLFKILYSDVILL